MGVFDIHRLYNDQMTCTLATFENIFLQKRFSLYNTEQKTITSVAYMLLF